jgi:hypothetical protein
VHEPFPNTHVECAHTHLCTRFLFCATVALLNFRVHVTHSAAIKIPTLAAPIYIYERWKSLACSERPPYLLLLLRTGRDASVFLLHLIPRLLVNFHYNTSAESRIFFINGVCALRLSRRAHRVRSASRQLNLKVTAVNTYVWHSLPAAGQTKVVVIKHQCVLKRIIAAHTEYFVDWETLYYMRSGNRTQQIFC